jgi:hypothetical protein
MEQFDADPDQIPLAQGIHYIGGRCRVDHARRVLGQGAKGQ